MSSTRGGEIALAAVTLAAKGVARRSRVGGGGRVARRSRVGGGGLEVAICAGGDDAHAKGVERLARALGDGGGVASPRKQRRASRSAAVTRAP